MSMPVRLCQFDLPNGELCRQVAIKDQYVCRHHIRNFRDADQQAAREVAMERLEDRLNQMDLPELLLTLERKLKRIVRTMPAFDEARVTLRIAIEQLHRQNEENAKLRQFLQTPHPQSHFESQPGSSPVAFKPPTTNGSDHAEPGVPGARGVSRAGVGSYCLDGQSHAPNELARQRNPAHS